MTQKKFYGLGGETYVYVADHPTDSALVLVQSAKAVQDGPRGAYIECPEGLIPNRLLELQRAQALLTNQDRTLQQAQDDLNKKLAERAALRVQIEELSKETP